MENDPQYRLLFEASPEAMLLAASGGVILDANPEACRVLGRARQEMVNLGREHVFDASDPRLQTVLEQQRVTGSCKAELWLLRADKTPFPAEVSLATNRVGEGGDQEIIVFRDVTERKLVENALLRDREQFQVLVENAVDMISLCNPDNTFRYVSPSVEQILGYRPEELLGTVVSNLVHPEDLEKYGYELIEEIMQGTGPHTPVTARYRHTDGSWRWLETTLNILVDDPSVAGVVCYSRDVTQQRLVEQQLRESEERYRRLVELSPEAIAVHAEGHFVYVNPAAARLLRARAPEDLIGKPVLDVVHPDYHDVVRSRIQKVFEEGAQSDLLEEQLVRLDGEVIYVEVTSIPVTDRGRPAVQSLVRDITQRKALELQLSRLAYHDVLTGLPNRSLFEARFEQARRRAAKTGRSLAVLFLDLDDFKAVNDSLGHAAGDRMLCLVAERLRAMLRAHDTVARLGGDEFCILLADLAGEGEAVGVTLRIMESLQAPYTVDGHRVSTTASIGIAVSSPHLNGRTDELMREADAAMYRAKKNGKALYELSEVASQA